MSTRSSNTVHIRRPPSGPGPLDSHRKPAGFPTVNPPRGLADSRWHNRRALWVAEFITTLAALFLIVLLVWGSWSHFDRSFDLSKPLWSRDSTIDIGLPVWPSKLLVPVAFLVLSLRLLFQIYGYGRALLLGLERPVSLPLIQTVAEQAREEAEQLEGRD